MTALPSRDALTICFAHVAYQMQAQFDRRNTGIACFQAWNRDELDRRIGEADVLVISGLWRDELLERAARLRFIQAIGAGTDQLSSPESRSTTWICPLETSSRKRRRRHVAGGDDRWSMFCSGFPVGP